MTVRRYSKPCVTQELRDVLSYGQTAECFGCGPEASSIAYYSWLCYNYYMTFYYVTYANN